jgi:hypothetical protein
MFGVVGIAAGSCLLSSCARQEIKTAQPAKSPAVLPWPYHELDPEATAERAYLLHYEGHCMYGVFTSIVGQLAEQYGEPYESFPFKMMSYGAGGVASWGSLCGALNGAAAAIALFASAKEQQARLTGQILLWHEQNELPVYVPAKPKLNVRIPGSIAHSVLCHPSVSLWCKASGYPVGGKEHMERCARLTADTARQTVQVLNEGLSGDLARPIATEKQVDQCGVCHGPKGQRKDALGKMTCGSCHTSLSDKHPSVPEAR